MGLPSADEFKIELMELAAALTPETVLPAADNMSEYVGMFLFYLAFIVCSGAGHSLRLRTMVVLNGEYIEVVVLLYSYDMESMI